MALSILDDETRAREFAPFAQIKDNYPKTVLTLDRIGTGDYNGAQHENVIDWMLREE